LASLSQRRKKSITEITVRILISYSRKQDTSHLLLQLTKTLHQDQPVGLIRLRLIPLVLANMIAIRSSVRASKAMDSVNRNLRLRCTITGIIIPHQRNCLLRLGINLPQPLSARVDQDQLLWHQRAHLKLVALVSMTLENRWEKTSSHSLSAKRSHIRE